MLQNKLLEICLKMVQKLNMRCLNKKKRNKGTHT